MVTAAQSRHSDTNITAIFAHMGHVFIFTWLQGIYFMSLFRRLKFGAFYMFSRFFFFYCLDQIIKLEVNLCLLDYNYLLLFTFHYYLPLYILHVLGPIRLEPIVTPNQHTFSVKRLIYFCYAEAWNFLHCLFCHMLFSISTSLEL